MELAGVMAAIVLFAVSFWYINNHCSICHSRIQLSDYMSTGTIRYRKRGTEIPVCRQCGNHHPELVE